MRIAKYDANPSNDKSRHTIHFRFSPEELALIGKRYGTETPEQMRFELEVDGGTLKLVPVKEGGMKVTKSPSGKSHPFEVGFNNRGRPFISSIKACGTTEVKHELKNSFIKVMLPVEAVEPNHNMRRSGHSVIRQSDFDPAQLRSPADLDLLRSAIATVNEVLARLPGVTLDVADGKLRAYLG